MWCEIKPVYKVALPGERVRSTLARTFCWLGEYDNPEDVEVDCKFDRCGEAFYLLHAFRKIAFLCREKQHDHGSFHDVSCIGPILIVSELELVMSVIDRDCHFGEINQWSP